MKVTIEKGALSIDLRELVDVMTPEQHTELCRHLVADDRLFMNVLEVVASGNYNEDDDNGSWWFNREALAELRLKLLPLVSGAMRGLIGELVRQRKQSELDELRHRKWAYQLYHAWPEHCWPSRPQGPADFVPAPTTEASEIDALVPQEVTHGS